MEPFFTSTFFSVEEIEMRMLFYCGTFFFCLHVCHELLKITFFHVMAIYIYPRRMSMKKRYEDNQKKKKARSGRSFLVVEKRNEKELPHLKKNNLHFDFILKNQHTRRSNCAFETQNTGVCFRVNIGRQPFVPSFNIFFFCVQSVIMLVIQKKTFFLKL